MDKDKVLDEIFNDDPFGLLNVKPKVSNVRTADERLIASFEEINKFVEQNGEEPKATTNTSEFMLYARLKGLRKDVVKVEQLKEYDIYNLLPTVEADQMSEGTAEYAKPKEIASIDDLLGDDLLGILDTDTEGLFDFKHTPKDYERAQADFVARRKPCKDFDKYEHLFIEVQKDLAARKRKLIDFKEGNLNESGFYVHNGILMFLERADILQEEQVYTSGSRVRVDGRTKCVFENGTESNMLYRSLAKILYANGRVVTENIDKVNEGFIEQFGVITEEDEEAGYIYVLKSKSKDEKIASVQNLYKIGYSKAEVEERIKNAEKQPTYLMAPVSIVGVWKGYNMNPQKLEQLLHNFFGNSCLNVDVFDDKGKRHTPQEWFIAPLEVIEQAIELIINRKIVNYKFDAHNKNIVGR